MVGDKLRKVFSTPRSRHRLVRREQQSHPPPVHDTSTASASTSRPIRTKPGGLVETHAAHAPADRLQHVRRIACLGQWRCPGHRRRASRCIRVPILAGRSGARQYHDRGLRSRVRLRRGRGAHADHGRVARSARRWRTRACSTRRSDCSRPSEQRAAELAIINSVQQGLAAKLDMQAIYDLVGDKLARCSTSQDRRHPPLRPDDRIGSTFPI